ncbi:MAG: hypothetical protein U0401_20875 [Anaerolineae bacterium]
MALRTNGLMGVEWEQRVDFERLRQERLARIKNLLKQSELGALLCFDMNNIRYITSTTIGTWAMDKIARFCLLAQDAEPINWDFGPAASIISCTAPGWRGTLPARSLHLARRDLPGAGRAEDVARKIRIELEERGLLNEPVGVDD